MNRALAQRGPAIRLRTLSLAALGTAVAVTGVAVAPDLLSDEGTLPADVAAAAPGSYTITYRVDAGGTVTTEVLTVQRPFAAHVRVHDGSSTRGRVLSERASALGVLATTSGGGWGHLVVPPAPATGDLRADAVVAAAREAGILTDLGEGSVGGRPCRRYEAATTIAGGTLVPLRGGERAVVCLDAAGLLLDERWEIDGEVVRTRRAVDLRIGSPGDPAIAVPEGEELTGSGQLRRLADDSPLPFPTAYRLAAIPEGFVLVGRYAVVPPDLDPSPAAGPAEPRVATVTDVWTRGADVLLLDQGASTGPDPFSPSAVAAPVALGVAGVEEASVVLDLRATEVRLRLADGAFARVAGTLPPEDLLVLARSLTRIKEVTDD